MSEKVSILLCRCERAEIVPSETVRQVAARLESAGAAFETTADLCGLCERRDDVLARLAGAGELRVAACFPRAVKWLFHAGGANWPEKASVANMRVESPADVAEMLLADAPRGAMREIPVPAAEGRTPWFPVIDYDRCTSCRQCLNFCLFGVYVADGKKVRAASPANCKLRCPACARVCPAGAIIFPKYGAGGYIAGDDTFPDTGGEKAGIAELMKGDVIARLRRRGAASPEASEVDLSPRLKGLLDIPDDVGVDSSVSQGRRESD